MNWTALDWKTLDRLREGFLSGSAAKGPYWKSRDDLAHYDATYAERIGWKWDAVLPGGDHSFTQFPEFVAQLIEFAGL